ncbi:sensor histidine kinase [Streptomyces sp. NBC_01142]|uniref:sensor histidine kinase n=1 Tax=Streptomyces sp. NBC_01142 TaxID=2975865 RepID=UPI00225270F6|nr:sensor histidine kinase [Streptomyces sp. NBC_01142]MCX4822942.1 sensor histidine kinase [Streptomyces sp. NBC_01142]
MTIPPRLRRSLTWLRRDLLFIASGVPLHLITAPLFLWAVTLIARTVQGTSSAAPAVLPVPAALIVIAGFGLTQAHRWRYRELCGVDLPRLRFAVAGRQLGYNCLVAPCLGVLELLVLALLVAGTAATTVYAWIMLLPVDWRTGHPGYTTQAAYVMAAGVLALSATPGLAGALVRLENRIAPGLLKDGPAEELKQRVEDLTESRAGAVDAADAERRRIERNLHDGAQQRLVSLALNLGIAKITLKDLPPEARQVIDDAHREAKESIEELNTLVRGLHPAVLDELGLDAALSGLAARAPLPVRLRVDMTRRAAPAVEAVAYFVVSEALTNIAKHARATRADVTVSRLGELLRVVIADDGVGGADPSGGTGLKGLSQRVGSVDGTFRMSSPTGGPTAMTVELPCVP